MEIEGIHKDIAMLKRRRGVIKGLLTRIRNFIRDFNPRDQPISLLEFRQDELLQINKKFDDVQSQIDLISEDLDQEEQERNTFETEYFHIRSQIQELVNTEKSFNSSTAHNTSTGSVCSSNRARLAPISLPTFNGDVQEWASFFDCFCALVHNDDSYSAAQKFHYLRTSLGDPALDMIRATPMTEVNYNTVVERLKQRYGNKSLVIQSHIRAILDSPRVKNAGASELQQLHSHVCSHVAALKALNQPVDQWDAWLVTIVTGRLDVATAQAWQLSCQDTELQRYEELEKFLIGRCTAFETTEAWSTDSSGEKMPVMKKFGKVPNMKRALITTESKNTITCVCCSENHRLFHCEKFKKLDLSARMNLVRQSSYCFNCLGPFHSADTCRSKFSCQKCKLKHNTLLHYEKVEEPQGSNNAERRASCLVTSIVQPQISLPISNVTKHVFLATALVMVKDNWGVYKECRAILDSGSQVNFISKKLTALLQLPRERVQLPIGGIGASMVKSVTKTIINLKSRVNQYEVDLPCHTLPVIVNELPRIQRPVQGWEIPSNLRGQLADPSFDQAGSVDLLIGASIFFDLLEVKRVKLGISRVSLQETKFGWILTGEIDTICLLSFGNISEDNWKITLEENDTYGRDSRANRKCLEEEEAFRHFKKNVNRDREGRFILKLPIKQETKQLGDSVATATSRFINIERRMQRDKNLQDNYRKFMEEYLELGHMREVSGETVMPHPVCYLPHHAVFKTTSLTTKVRVVFDASARTSSGVSLNDILMRGPTVQEDIFSILSRFRKHQFVITSDIEKMFRQIAIAEEHWDLQRILWRFNPEEALKTYRLCTVTYGTTPASFMATQCLVTLSEQFKEKYPRASCIIKSDFYMDDLMTGCDSEEECCQLQDQITTILNSAKLPLRKWCSNSATVLERIGKRENDPLFTLNLDDDEAIKSLGLGWKPVNDEFLFNVTALPDRMRLTKRTLLSDLNKVFDPLGFLAPVLIKGKIFLQQLWQLKTDWDTPLSEEIQTKWKKYYSELQELGNISIPRKVQPALSKIIEIHGFCDASVEAYGACVYVRTLSLQGEWNARLLCSKSRVAPLKGATIPRLELSGALLLVQLVEKVAKSWNINVQEFRLWTDSMVVLAWMNSQTSRLKTFVANRICQILESTSIQQWRHVKTDDNPADVLSRGTTPREIKVHNQWWQGPRWLSEDSVTWLTTPLLLPEEDTLPEKRPMRLALITVESTMDLLNYYSKWRKLVRAAAWLLKFIEFRRTKNRNTLSKYLNVVDLKKAETGLIKRAQLDDFHDELHALNMGKEVSRKSNLKCLYPVLRKDNIILVGGRLDNAEIDEEQKHPIILPAKHKVTKLIFEDTHERLLHGGPQLLLAGVRQQYWPLKGRIMARSVTTRCVTCIRARPTFVHPLMAPLPRTRLQPSRPFTVSGVDFAGPLVVRSGVRRVTGVKAWIAVFVCFSTRAIHLEAVVGLTSGAFLAALRRFMSRRGKCSTIHSDNGTNFVGARKELASYTQNCESNMAREGIEWKFNPPSAPHFGGLWESAVKSTKHHLNRTLKDSRLNLEELTTLLCQIEACINSRPITPLSTDPSELAALTPAYFLIGGSLVLLPEPSFEHGASTIAHLTRWKYVQALTQGFWNRWHKEYLPQLQVRGRWVARKPPLKVGDVVIVKDELTPPSRWKLARVTKTHPGSDNVIRVVTIRLASGTEMKRPAVKLCPLPTEDHVNEVEPLGLQRGENVAAAT